MKKKQKLLSSDELTEVLRQQTAAVEHKNSLLTEVKTLTAERDKIKNSLKTWKGKLAAAEKLLESEENIKNNVQSLENEKARAEKQLKETQDLISAAKKDLEELQCNLPDDFIIPESYKEGLLDCWASDDGGEVNLFLKKKEKGWFGREKEIVKKIRIGIEHSYASFFKERSKKYLNSLRKYLRKKNVGGNLVELADAALLSNENYVKDQFILKVIEELKNK